MTFIKLYTPLLEKAGVEDIKNIHVGTAIAKAETLNIPEAPEVKLNELMVKGLGVDLDMVEWLLVDSGVVYSFLSKQVELSRQALYDIKYGFTKDISKSSRVSPYKIRYEVAVKLTQYAYQVKLGEKQLSAPPKKAKAKKAPRKKDTKEVYRQRAVRFLGNVIEKEDVELFEEYIAQRKLELGE